MQYPTATIRQHPDAGEFTTNMRILVIEDDAKQRSFIARGLSEAGHVPETVDNGRHGLQLAECENFDALIIDRMLPAGMDGLEVVRRLRSKGDRTPVLILTTLGKVHDRVEGLSAGADDYLPKPFEMIELLARIEAIVRRADPVATDTRLVVEDLAMDLLTRSVTRGGKKISLRPTEFKILEVLMRYSGRIVTRTMLMQKIWRFDFDSSSENMNVHIFRIRKQIDDGFSVKLLHTVRGSGYILRAEEP